MAQTPNSAESNMRHDRFTTITLFCKETMGIFLKHKIRRTREIQDSKQN